MPRPKVRPEDRQRSSKACLPCQASKIRCDSQTPCISCVRRDRSAACTYVETHRRRLPRARRTGEVRFAPFSGPANGLPASKRGRTLNEPTHRSPEGDVDGDVELTSSILEAPSVQSPECTESRLLLSSKGEKGRITLKSTSMITFDQLNRMSSLYWRDIIALIFAVFTRDYEAIYGPILFHRKWPPEYYARGRNEFKS